MGGHVGDPTPPFGSVGPVAERWQWWSACELVLRGGTQIMQQNVLPMWRLLVVAMLGPKRLLHCMGLVVVRLAGGGQLVQTKCKWYAMAA